MFDVKEYGIGFPHIKNFEMKLQKQVNQLFDMKIKSFLEESQKNINMLEEEKHNQATIDSEVEEKLDCEKRKKDRMDIESKSGLWKYTVSVDGLSNMGMDELSNQIESVGDVAKVLVDKAWEERINKWEDYTTWNDDNPIVKHGSGFFREHIDGLGITCTLESVFSEEIRGTFHIETYEINIYEWAMNNKFYFMGDASQFVNNKPYVIICVLDKSDNLFLGNVNQYDSYFRPLCRRIFIELNSMTNRDIKTSFDGKARVGYSISEAVKKITGIIFLEITELIDEKNDDTPMWIYLNPNADNPLLDFQIFQLKLMKPKTVEDYEYDNY